MAVATAQVNVSTSTVLLSGAEGDGRAGQSLVLVNAGSLPVYLGAAAVTTGTGFPLAAGTSLSLDLDANESLYGVAASGTQPVNVLRTGT